MPIGASGQSTRRHIPDTVTVVESFERTDPVAVYGGDTGSFAGATAQAVDGSKSLEQTATDDGTYSISRTDKTTQQGNKYTFYVYPTGTTTNIGCFLFTQSETREPNGYLIDQSFTGDGLDLYVNNNGFTQIANVDHIWSADTRYRFEWEITTSGGHTVTAFNDETGSQVAQVTATDTTFSSGGIGWRASNADLTAYYDYLTEEGL